MSKTQNQNLRGNRHLSEVLLVNQLKVKHGLTIDKYQAGEWMRLIHPRAAIKGHCHLSPSEVDDLGEMYANAFKIITK